MALIMMILAGEEEERDRVSAARGLRDRQPVRGEIDNLQLLLRIMC